MALISSTTIITSVSLFHLTIAFFFLTNPRAVNDQVLVYVLGERMRMVRTPNTITTSDADPPAPPSPASTPRALRSPSSPPSSPPSASATSSASPCPRTSAPYERHAVVERLRRRQRSRHAHE